MIGQELSGAENSWNPYDKGLSIRHRSWDSLRNWTRAIGFSRYFHHLGCPSWDSKKFSAPLSNARLFGAMPDIYRRFAGWRSAWFKVSMFIWIALGRMSQAAPAMTSPIKDDFGGGYAIAVSISSLPIMPWSNRLYRPGTSKKDSISA